MTVLIGFNGRRRSGKNTAGQVAHEWGMARGLTAPQRGFADLLKLSAARALGIASATNINDAVVVMDELKECGFINIEIPSLSYAQGFTGREYLKWFGTESHRDVFEQNFWVDLVLPTNQYTSDGDQIPWQNFWIESGLKIPDIAIITDVRFVNEAERVLECGGKVVEIHRPGLESDNHASELPLPRELVSYTIENDSTLESFKTDVNSWMTGEYHMHFIETPDLFD